MTKKCTKCGQVKPTSEFGTRKDRKGATVPRNACRDCLAAADRVRRSKQEKVAPSAIRVVIPRGDTPPVPLPTEADMRAWWLAGCPVR